MEGSIAVSRSMKAFEERVAALHVKAEKCGIGLAQRGYSFMLYDLESNRLMDGSTPVKYSLDIEDAAKRIEEYTAVAQDCRRG